MECYQVEIGHVTDKRELFEQYTRTMYLGESGIGNWDAFADLLYLRLQDSDINVVVNHVSPIALPSLDKEIYLRMVNEMRREFNNKISFKGI